MKEVKPLRFKMWGKPLPTSKYGKIKSGQASGLQRLGVSKETIKDIVNRKEVK